MLETLAGVLKWERTVTGIRVEIPAPLSPKSGLYTILLGIAWLWLLAGDVLRWVMDARHMSGYDRAYSGLSILCALAILASFLWIILTSTRIVLSPDRMAIEYHVHGVRWLSRRCPTCLLHNPRLVRNAEGLPGFFRHPWQVQIDRDYRTKVLAVGVDPTEGEALIVKLKEVYPFPKYLPVGSAAGAPGS